jgi:hypothetical protein
MVGKAGMLELHLPASPFGAALPVAHIWHCSQFDLASPLPYALPCSVPSDDVALLAPAVPAKAKPVACKPDASKPTPEPGPTEPSVAKPAARQRSTAKPASKPKATKRSAQQRQQQQQQQQDSEDEERYSSSGEESGEEDSSEVMLVDESDADTEQQQPNKRRNTGSSRGAGPAAKTAKKAWKPAAKKSAASSSLDTLAAVAAAGGKVRAWNCTPGLLTGMPMRLPSCYRPLPCFGSASALPMSSPHPAGAAYRICYCLTSAGRRLPQLQPTEDTCCSCRAWARTRPARCAPVRSGSTAESCWRGASGFAHYPRALSGSEP